MCETTEIYFQRLLKTTNGQPPQGRGTTSAIVNKVLAACGKKTPFPQLHSHMFEANVECNHILAGENYIILVLPNPDAPSGKETKQNKLKEN